MREFHYSNRESSKALAEASFYAYVHLAWHENCSEDNHYVYVLNDGRWAWVTTAFVSGSGWAVRALSTNCLTDLVEILDQCLPGFRVRTPMTSKRVQGTGSDDLALLFEA